MDKRRTRRKLPLVFVVPEDEHNEGTQTIISGVVERYLKTKVDGFVWSAQYMDIPLVAMAPLTRDVGGFLEPIYVSESMRAYLLGRVNLEATRGFRLISPSPMLPYAMHLMKENAVGVDPTLLAMATFPIAPFLLVEDDRSNHYAWDRVRVMAENLEAECAIPAPVSEDTAFFFRSGVLVESDVGVGRDVYVDLAEMWEGEVLRNDPLVVKGSNEWYRAAADEIFLGKLPRSRVDATWCREENVPQATFVAVTAYLELVVEYPHLYPFLADVEIRTGGISVRVASAEELRRYTELLDPPENLGTISVFSASTLEEAVAMRWYFQEQGHKTMVVGNYDVVVGAIVPVPSKEGVLRALSTVKDAFQLSYILRASKEGIFLGRESFFDELLPMDRAREAVRSVPFRVGSTWLGEGEIAKAYFYELGLRGYFTVGTLPGILSFVPLPEVSVPGEVFYKEIAPKTMAFRVAIDGGGTLDLFDVDPPSRMSHEGSTNFLSSVSRLWRRGWFLSPWGLAHVVKYGRPSRAGSLRYLGDWRHAVGAVAIELIEAFGR